MRCLDEAVLVWAVFLELRLEELLFVVCNRLLIQYQDLGYVVLVRLGYYGQHTYRHAGRDTSPTDLILQILEHLHPLLLDQI